MKYILLLFSLLFAMAAYVQFNDPDPLLWVATYGIMTIMSILGFLKRTNRWLTIGLFIVFAGWMISMWPGMADWIAAGTPSISDEMKASTPYVEIVREFFGLLLCEIALLLIYFLNHH